MAFRPVARFVDARRIMTPGACSSTRGAHQVRDHRDRRSQAARGSVVRPGGVTNGNGEDLARAMDNCPPSMPPKSPRTTANLTPVEVHSRKPSVRPRNAAARLPWCQAGPRYGRTIGRFDDDDPPLRWPRPAGR